ncbi:hypothetical protein ABIF43_004434 [Bradyrhizobium japonicum]
MNHSIYTADRATHLKVVVSVLLVGIAIVAATLTVRLTHPATSAQITATHTVYKPHRRPRPHRNGTNWEGLDLARSAEDIK